MIIESVKQTPFVSYDNKNLVKIRIGDWDTCNPYDVKIFVDGVLVFSKTISTDCFDALLPVGMQQKSCRIVVTPLEGIEIQRQLTLKTPKHWKINILYSSHEDLGYCGYIDKLDYEFYLNLKKAMELCEKFPDFRYVIEHYEWLRSFERYANEEECLRLKDLFNKKKIELNAIPCGIHTHWAEGNQLIESEQLVTKVSAKKWGICPETAIYSDISGLTVQCVSAYANQGIHYVGVLYNRYRRQNYAGEIPLICRWYAPNGKDSVLLWNTLAYRCPPLRVWCGNKRFDHSEFYFDETKSLQTEQAITEMIDSLGDVPYSVYPVSYYDDHEVPTPYLHTVCQYMNKKWKSPQFSLEVPSVFLKEIELQSGNKLPVLNGDLTDQWADFESISPDWVSVKREAMRKKYEASLLDTLAAVKFDQAYPEDIYEEAVRLSAMFDEHCWASSAKHPMKMHIYNAYYVKKYSADKAMKLVSDRLKTHIGTPDRKIGLYNLLPQARTGGLKLNENTPVPAGIRSQRLPEGQVITDPITLPAMSCRNYDIRTEEIPNVTECGYSFETKFYKVIINNISGQIESIQDKTTNKELIDSNARFGFGEFIYTVADDKQSPVLNYETPKENEIRVEEGEVAYVVYKRSYEEQSCADIYTTIIFYKKEKQIDVDIRYENATSLMGDFYERYKKNIFLAFPFNIENPSFFTQLPGGGAHGEKEKIQCAPLDFSAAENWVSVEGNSMGIGVLSRDMPLFHFGGINLHRFMPKAEYDSSHVYLYAASNKMNSLNYTRPEHCRGSFAISILPYLGHWTEQMQKWSLEKVLPPLTGQPGDEAISGIVLDRDVRLLSVKPTALPGDSILVTLSEVNGRDEKDVHMTMPFRPISAWYTDFNGNTIGKAQIHEDDVIFDIQSLSYAVLNIQGDFHIQSVASPYQEIYDILTVDIKNHDSILSFEKSKDLKAKSFRIIDDGRLLAEVQNSPLRIQRIELQGRPKNIQIEINK